MKQQTILKMCVVAPVEQGCFLHKSFDIIFEKFEVR